jgi:NADPH2:quinone reductase
MQSGFPGQDPYRELAAKKARFVGPSESALMRNIGGEFHQWCAKLFDIMTKHKIAVRVHGTYPLSEIRKVHEDLEARKTTGKVLVRP